MASRTSSTGVVNRGTSGGDSYYVTDVTTLAGGGVRTETYRTDGAGNNRVLIRTIDVNKQGEKTKNEISSNATIEEQRDFLNKRSTFNRLIDDQVESVKSDLESEVTNNGGNANQIFKLAAGGTGNISIETESGNTNGGGTLSPSQPTQFDISRLEIKGRRQKKYENLFYPENIVSSKQDRIRFTMFHQTGRSFNFNLENPDGNPFTFGERNITEIDGSVTLPIQGGISDRNEVSFTGQKLNPVTGALASIAFDPIAAGAQILSVLNEDVSTIQARLGGEVSQNAVAAIRTYLAQTAVGTSGLIPRTTGAILNPNLELLLESPELRSFEFAFKMSARSKSEANQIKKIIRFFKQGMSVKRSKSSLFVVTPNLFKIRYLTDDGFDHPSIGRIKKCALMAINTEYTPDGTYMTFDDEDRTMTSYQIQMTFKELEPLTEDDYTAGRTTNPILPNDNQIGY